MIPSSHNKENSMTASAAEKKSAELKVGDKAPLFDVKFDNKQEVTKHMLWGKNMVIYFYPKDDTPGCTIEAKDFRDLIKDFEKANTVVIGVSKDSVKSHDAFKEKYCLPFPLASDESGKMCEDYDV